MVESALCVSLCTAPPPPAPKAAPPPPPPAPKAAGCVVINIHIYIHINTCVLCLCLDPTHAQFFSSYVAYHASHNYISVIHEHTHAHILSHPMVGTAVFSVANLALTMCIYPCVFPLMQLLLLPLRPRPRLLRPPRRPRPQVVRV